MKSLIARKLITYLILFSSVVTLIITAVQLNSEFQQDVSGIHKRLAQIKNSHLKSVTQATWFSDSKQLQVILDGVTEMPDIVYAKVTSDNQKDIVSGLATNEDKINFKIDLNYQYNNHNIKIGSFIVVASLNDIYSRLFKRLKIILISNAIKTFLVAFFIGFLFYQLVAQHLLKISRFLIENDPFAKHSPLSLDKKNKRSDKLDELDGVVIAINELHHRIHEQFIEIDKQKQHLYQTLNSIGDAVITTDEKANIKSLNPIAEKLTGWRSKEAKLLPLEKVFRIKDASTGEIIINPVEKVLQTGETIYLSNHTTLISKDNKEFQIADSAAPIMVNGAIVGIVLVFNDVTEQYLMRESLKESYSLLKKVSSSMPGMMYQFEMKPDGSFSFPYVSEGVNDVYKLDAGEAKENIDKFFGMTHPDDIGHLYNSIEKSAKELSPWVLEYRVIDTDSTIRWLYGKSIPEKTKSGSILWHGYIMDISKDKEKDEKLRRTQKMDALGKLTGGIAHDYNNMLGVMLGYAELLEEFLKDQPNLLKYVREINHAGQRGAKLTKKLLSFSRRRSSSDDVLNVSDLLHEQTLMLEKTLTARINLKLFLAEDLWLICVDEGDLEDVILNMSINAMHAIKNSGDLTITTNNKTLGKNDVDGQNIEPGDFVEMTISDTGHGIDEESLDKIFDPFYSTKGDFGTGLGLSQVYGFVKRCQGMISLESIVGEGTTFKLYFPRYLGEEILVENKILTEDKLKGNESILVVDDEVALLKLTCSLLKNNGYHVYEATNAMSALEILKNENIHLLLSDIIMPEIDGYELAMQAQKKYPHLKIQLVSGYTGTDGKNKNSDLAKNVLNKPISSKDLLNRIDTILHKS